MRASNLQGKDKVTDQAVPYKLRNDALAISFVLLLALVIRLMFLEGYLVAPVLDPSFSGGLLTKYPLLGEQIIAGKGIAKRVFHSSPFYIYFWALFIRVFGLNFYLARVLHIIFSALNCCLIYIIGRKLFSRPCALIASGAAALYAPFIVHDGTFITAVFVVFLNLMLVLMLLYASARHATNGNCLWQWLLSGVILGLAIIIRPNATLLIPIILVWIYLALRISSLKGTMIVQIQKLLLPVTLFCLGITPIVLLVTVRNYLVAGDPVIVTSSGGWIFYIGNNPLATGLLWTWPRYESFVVSGKYETDPTHRVSRGVASKLVGRELTSSEAADYWFLQGLQFIKQEPRKYLLLMLNKLYYFCNSFEPPDTREIFRRMCLIERYPLLRLGFIEPFAIIGMIVCFKEWRRLWLLYGFSAVYFGTALIFFVNSRYRIPIVPFLLLFAAYAILWLIKKCLERRLLDVIAASLFVIAVLPVFNYEDFRILNLRAQMEGHCDYLEPAQELMRASRYGDAELLLKELVRKNFTFKLTMSAHQLLSEIYGSRGEEEKALLESEKGRGPICAEDAPYRFLKDRSAYLRQLEQYPNCVSAHNCMGYLYWRAGDYEAAAREFERVVKLCPKFAAGHLNLAINYNRLHRYRDALKEAKLSLQLAPNNPLADREIAYAYERQ